MRNRPSLYTAGRPTTERIKFNKVRGRGGGGEELEICQEEELLLLHPKYQQARGGWERELHSGAKLLLLQGNCDLTTGC